MLIIIGFLVVILSVVGGYIASHGKLAALWQPFELVIIGGAAFGAFLVSTPMKTVKETFSAAIGTVKGPRYQRQDYLDVLSLLYELLNKARREGFMSLEEHVENPTNSPLFANYPKVMAPSHALTKVADGLPGFGIVAAVLGIVITMGSIGGDIAEVGAHVAAALVGTFLGILLAYGFIGPLATAMEARAEQDARIYESVKTALLACLRGYNPKIALEFARKTVPSNLRPGFSEFEQHLKSVK